MFQNLYIKLLVITLLIFLNLKNVFADETLIGLNATAKHYCNCLFVSELNEEYCDIAYDRLFSVSLNDQELIEQLKLVEYTIDDEEKEIKIEFDKYKITSKFSENTGCYFNN